MRIVRNAVLKDSKKIPTIMIIIALLMLVFCFVNLSIDFAAGIPAISIELFNTWTSVISIIPITWAVCSALLIKTKKVIFSKMPAYIICSMVLLGFILYYIAAGNNDVVYTLLVFAIAVLLAYPFIISTLTIEGRMYNKVFATVFNIILLIISTIAAVAVCIVLKSIMLSSIIPALIYVELTLAVHCYNLEKIKKSDNNENTNLITH